MSAVYIDTSALARVLLDEPDSMIIERALEGFRGRASSRLLGVELRRVAEREQLGDAAEILLSDIAFIPLDDAVLTRAERIEPRGVATLDAIHLATAVLLHERDRIEVLLTYDKRLADGARHHGIDVLSPA